MKKRKQQRAEIQTGKDFLKPVFDHKYEHLLFIGLMFVLLSIFFFNQAYLGYGPRASDTIQWRGAAQVLIEYNEENPDQALWNSNLFSGMPSFLISYPSRYPFIKEALNFITKYLINWTVFFMFLAGAGMYVLMLSLGFKPVTAFVCGMAFALSPHFIGLVEIGHNTKFRAIVYIPWIMWSLNYLFKHRNMLGMGLTAMFLIQQLRENHVQISYYTFIMIIIFWIFNFFWFKKKQQVKEFGNASWMFAVVLIITAMAVTHPYLSVWEHSPYTIRGNDGLTFEYATSWSFHPLEMITFIIPDFFGGISPFYWGWMPFTQTSMYMGVVIFALALLAIFHWKVKIVKFLTVVTIVALLFSFGKHIQPLTRLLLNYLPFYDKFRVPAMILALVQFSVVVMAGYGLKHLLDKYKENDERFTKNIQKLFIVCAIIMLIFIAMSEMGAWSGLPLEHHTDAARYEPRQIEFLRESRMEALANSSITSFLFLTLFFLAAYLLVKRKTVTPYLFLVIIAAITITDLMLVNRQHLPGLSHKQPLEEEFEKTGTDRFLLEDDNLYRIFPLMEEFGHSRWAYHHQTIGGYHGAKLRRYQDIIDNSLHAELRYREPINWNIVRMLNVKYLISPVQLPFDNLERSFYDRQQQLTTYELENRLPRAWFVEETETILDKQSIFRRLNSPEFDPEISAILETELYNIQAPDSSHVAFTHFCLHDIDIDVTTDQNSLLVLSEIYYPAGWNAYLNGQQIDIHPVNYILRGMEIPPGNHTLELRFEPTAHRYAVVLSLIGILATLILVVAGTYLYFKKNYAGKIEYVIKS